MPAPHFCGKNPIRDQLGELPYYSPFRGATVTAERCAALLEDEIAFQGADTIAAFIMEPVLRPEASSFRMNVSPSGCGRSAAGIAAALDAGLPAA